MPIHATPLYSILGNIIVGIVMLKVWTLHVSLSLVIGLYLILSGLARFVEESYRAEPQTRVLGGLRIYQWLAIASVVAGMGLTMISGTPPATSTDPNWSSIIAAAGVGLFAWFLMGVDFPQSNKRFARLV